MHRATAEHYEAALNRLHTEENWIAEHGGDESGFVARYGSVRSPNHYGDGGEAIYAADRNTLDRARAEVAALRPLVDPIEEDPSEMEWV